MTPFEVKDFALLIRISGLPPGMNLREPRDRIASCGENVLSHHFCETPLRPTFDDPDYRNDFAVWAKFYLGDRVLAERLGILDPYSYERMEEVRGGGVGGGAVPPLTGDHRLSFPQSRSPSQGAGAGADADGGCAMSAPLAAYEAIVNSSVVAQLRRLGKKLAGRRVVHVNSTREGGGVAEILEWMVPHMRDVGIDASWEVIHGTPRFFEITKGIHNGLQGKPVELLKKDWKIYQDVNEENAARLKPLLEEADLVLIHDPQPDYLLKL